MQLVERVPFKFPAGQLAVTLAERQEQLSFLDYIAAGLEISLIIAIDFTLSNKAPSDPGSLHYFDLQKNQYLQAIMSVGGILENYDSAKRYPLLGFGGRVPGLLDRTSHCFAVNGDIFRPEVSGISGVIESKMRADTLTGYKNALTVVQLHGPTYFAELLGYLNAMVEHEAIKCQCVDVVSGA